MNNIALQLHYFIHYSKKSSCKAGTKISTLLKWVLPCKEVTDVVIDLCM
jgi:hypothetical protein